MISLGRTKRRRRWEIKRVDFAFVEGGDYLNCVCYILMPNQPIIRGFGGLRVSRICAEREKR